jgi:hypothetical protein
MGPLPDAIGLEVVRIRHRGGALFRAVRHDIGRDPLRWAYAIAASFVAKDSFTCVRVSAELVQPISGSISRGLSASISMTQRPVFACPDWVAVLAGL